jgi:hypothetical protein
MFGATVSDNGGGTFSIRSMQDLGNRGSIATNFGGFQNGGFPAVNSNFVISLQFSFSQFSTTLTGGFFNSTATASTGSQLLNPLTNLSFAMVRDNESSEQYQVNSLDISVIPAPATLLPLCAVAGVRAHGRRRRPLHTASVPPKAAAAADA